MQKIQKCLLLQRVTMEFPSLQDTIQFQNCGDQQLHGAPCTIIFSKFPIRRTQPPPWALLQLCTQGLFRPQPPVLFSGQEIRKTRLTEMPLLVRKSLIYSRNLEVHFFHYKLSKFYPLPRCSKISD